MSVSRSKVRDKGEAKFNKFLKEINRQLSTTKITVGVHEDKGSTAHRDSQGLTVAEIAAIHEYGIRTVVQTKDGGSRVMTIPERSWLRGWVDPNSQKITAFMARRCEERMQAASKGEKPNFLPAFEATGVWAVGQIQQRIAQGIDPDNADSTIDAKGSSTPLIDSGQFRQSISSKVVTNDGK